MKLSTIMAGTALVALAATPALAGPNIYQAAATVGPGANGPTVQINTATPATGWYLEPGDSFNNTQAIPVGAGQNFPASASTEMLQALAALGLLNTTNTNISLIQITGGAANNNGTNAGTDGATFTLKGNVTTDCAYYSGNVSTTIDFGQIGIYADDNTGPAAAFDMTQAANVAIETNLAGCNTSNTVTISKNDIRGLVNNSGAGYDSNVFQANLPYSVTASYTAGNVGTAAPGSAQSLVLAANANSASASHGAWKSAMDLNVNIPVPTNSLLAGIYEGQMTVAITAF